MKGQFPGPEGAQFKVEAEIAFVMGRDLPEPQIQHGAIDPGD
jgi:2-keto-4-pentenoate hydratase